MEKLSGASSANGKNCLDATIRREIVFSYGQRRYLVIDFNREEKWFIYHSPGGRDCRNIFGLRDDAGQILPDSGGERCGNQFRRV